jgi:hypothetical protein
MMDSMPYDFETQICVQAVCEGYLKNADDPVCDYDDWITVSAIGDVNGCYFDFTCPQCGKEVVEAWSPYNGG